MLPGVVGTSVLGPSGDFSRPRRSLPVHFVLRRSGFTLVALRCSSPSSMLVPKGRPSGGSPRISTWTPIRSTERGRRPGGSSPSGSTSSPTYAPAPNASDMGTASGTGCVARPSSRLAFVRLADPGYVRGARAGSNSCMHGAKANSQPAARLVEPDARHRSREGLAMPSRPMKGVLKLGPGIVVGPLRGHKPVAIRTSPRVEPRWLGTYPWARSTGPTAGNPRAWRNLSSLALLPRLWLNCLNSFVELTLSIERPPGPQIAIQPARLDVPERCLGRRDGQSPTDSRRGHVRTAIAHSGPTPVLRPSLPLNGGLPKPWRPCSWRTTGASKTRMGRPGSTSMPEGA